MNDNRQDTAARLLTPFIYLNFAGMAVAALWLVSLSQWQFIWIGMVALFLAPHIIPLLMIPAGIMAHFMALYQGSGKNIKEKILYATSLVYIVSVISFIGAWDFSYMVHGTAPAAHWPALIWAAATSIIPFLIWSSGDRSNAFVLTIVLAAEIAALALLLAAFFYGVPPFWMSFFLLGGIALLLTTARIVYDDVRSRKTAR